MALTVEMPVGCESEKSYIAQVILGDFLGLDFTLIFSVSLAEIRVFDDAGRELIMPDVFFRGATDHWLAKDSMPALPLQKLRRADLRFPVPSLYSDLPVIYGQWRRDTEAPVSVTSTQVRCGIDVFGSCFFMLSRYEEAVSAERNRYGNFSYSASIFAHDDLVLRPLVNEYLELLWACLSHLWPGLERRSRAYRLVLTHDVDRPLSMQHLGIMGLGKKLAAGLLYYRDLDLTLRRLRGFIQAKRGDHDADSFNTFDFIMDTAERHGLRSAFFFITDHSAGRIDGDYRLEDPWIRRLLRKIHDRGHEIGLHGSYNTHKDQKQINREVEILRTVCAEEGFNLGIVGGRQHYLRWEVLDTWDIWDRAGLAYDSTLGFAEHVGFRAGTCYEYTAYSLRQRKPLNLRERPIIVMDTTLAAGEFMALDLDAAKPLVLELIKICRFYRGDFVCLFHNSSLETRAQKRFFSEVVAEAV